MESSVFKNSQTIIKEGFLEKESRYFKSWRKRWFVLTNSTLYSFKERKEYSSATETIPIRSITAVKSHEEHKEFCFVSTSERTYILGATSNVEKEQWISQIGKAIAQLAIKEEDAD